jgi:hypothetical protein
LARPRPEETINVGFLKQTKIEICPERVASPRARRGFNPFKGWKICGTVYFTLTLGFSPVTLRVLVVSAASAAFDPAKKPLKRLFSPHPSSITGLKPGANGIAILNENRILKTSILTILPPSKAPL